jgi:hypothetical protein
MAPNGVLLLEETRMNEFVALGWMYRSLRLALTSLTLVFGGIATSFAQTAPLVADSYDMRNGGTSTPGSSLRDDSYLGGSGNPAVPYSLLAGGRGDLTDGIVATSNWDLTPGPFVGWSQAFEANPSITFRFGQMVDLASVKVHINKGYAPGSIDLTMGSITRHAGVDLGLSGAANAWAEFSDLGLTGDALVLRLNDHAPDVIARDWILISEVSFTGAPTAAVPQPGSFALMLAGLLAVNASRRALHRKSHRMANTSSAAQVGWLRFAGRRWGAPT